MKINLIKKNVWGLSPGGFGYLKNIAFLNLKLKSHHWTKEPVFSR